MSEQIIHRKPWGDTFTYRYPSGRTVKNARLRQWIQSLAIPPAWTEVEITTDRDAKVLASGRDASGRRQHIYNPQWTEQAAERKFRRIQRFGEQLSVMRRATGQHLKQRPINADVVLACMVRMLDEAFFRPGSRRYTEQNQSHGLTTLRSKHMREDDGAMVFEYSGKSGKEQRRIIEDESVCEVLQELEEMTGYELFDVTLEDGERHKFTASDLNEYIGDVMGEDFTAKDFRTWAGTLLMAVALDEAGPQTDEKLTASEIVSAVKEVAGRLGNTPAICRESYIHPQVISAYEQGKTLRNFRKQLKQSKGLLSDEEHATIRLIKEVS